MTDVNNAQLSDEQKEAADKAAAEAAAKPGEKTDPALLLKSLQDEREKRRIAEEELQKEIAARPTGNAVSEEGKMLLDKITSLEVKLTTQEKEQMRESLHAKFPQLKDKADEFEKFVTDNQGMRLDTAAKAFLIENDLLASPRKGLERQAGGTRVPLKEDMSAEDVAELRVNNFRKYSQMVREGKIKL